MHDWVALPAGAWLVFSAERKKPAPRFELGEKARTVKCGGRKWIIMPTLRMKACVHESCPEGALVHRKSSRRRVDAGGDRCRQRNIALPHGARVCRRDGVSVMRYVRVRRLSEAARALANGAPDILQLALDADYGSHEAFTRAFRDHFGITPEMLRASARLDHIKLQDPIPMDSTLTQNLEPPRFATGKPLLIAGIGERISSENGAGIPGQWQRFH